MGALSAILFNMGLGLGWVYLFMGIVIGSAVIPLWNMMMWDKASGTGAVVAAWTSQWAAVIVWISVASAESGEVTIASLGMNYPMLAGNLVAILLSGAIHFAWSTLFPQNYDWKSMKDIKLIEDDQSGLEEELYDPKELEAACRWIKKWGFGLTVLFVVIWPRALGARKRLHEGVLRVLGLHFALLGLLCRRGDYRAADLRVLGWPLQGARGHPQRRAVCQRNGARQVRQPLLNSAR
jgi:hypothetical protein